MGIRIPQNPGIGGLDELTDAEELFIQNIAGLSYASGDILYHDGSDLQRLAKGTDGQILKLTTGIPAWATAGGTGDMLIATYDAATVSEQLVGLTAIQTLTNKTLTSPKINEDVVVTSTATELNLLTGITTLSGSNTGDQTPTSLGLVIGTDVLAYRTFGTAAAQDVGYFATAAQGGLADSALQALAFAGLSDYPANASGALTNDGAGNLSWTAGGAGDMILASVQSVTGLKTFDTTKLAMKGSSTGVTAIASANASATSYTATLQASTGTLAYTTDITGTNSGTNTGDNTVATALTGTPSITVANIITTGTLDLGHADDTTIARVSAGLVSIQGSNILTAATGAAIDQTMYIGTTAVAINRGTAALTLAGITLTSPTFTTPILGTPQSGTLTNCTFPTLNQNTTGTAAGLSATLAIASGGTGATTLAAASIPTYISTNTFTNKRITKRTGTTTSAAIPTINTDNVDFYSLTAQAEAITSFTTNLSGTPTENQTLWIAITGTAARAITWGTSFEASTTALPATTVTTARLDVGFVWNTVTSKWRCVASA